MHLFVTHVRYVKTTEWIEQLFPNNLTPNSGVCCLAWNIHIWTTAQSFLNAHNFVKTSQRYFEWSSQMRRCIVIVKQSDHAMPICSRTKSHSLHWRDSWQSSSRFSFAPHLTEQRLLTADVTMERWVWAPACLLNSECCHHSFAHLLRAVTEQCKYTSDNFNLYTINEDTVRQLTGVYSQPAKC